MQKVFHALIALGCVIFFVGSVLFVLGQAVCLVTGQPEMITTIETSVDAVIFPTISIVGVLAWIYSLIWKKPKEKKS